MTHLTSCILVISVVRQSIKEKEYKQKTDSFSSIHAQYIRTANSLLGVKYKTKEGIECRNKKLRRYLDSTYAISDSFYKYSLLYVGELSKK